MPTASSSSPKKMDVSPIMAPPAASPAHWCTKARPAELAHRLYRSHPQIDHAEDEARLHGEAEKAHEDAQYGANAVAVEHGEGENAEPDIGHGVDEGDGDRHGDADHHGEDAIGHADSSAGEKAQARAREARNDSGDFGHLLAGKKQWLQRQSTAAYDARQADRPPQRHGQRHGKGGPRNGAAETGRPGDHVEQGQHENEQAMRLGPHRGDEIGEGEMRSLTFRRYAPQHGDD